MPGASRGPAGWCRSAAPLTDPGEAPFREHVLALLGAVRGHDLSAMQALCDDTLGIVDAGPDLQPVLQARLPEGFPGS